MPRQAALPSNLPPRLIDRAAAAAYVNLSPTTFDFMVNDGKMPKPRKLIGRRHAWDVRSLDCAVDALPIDGADDDSWSDVDAS